MAVIGYARVSTRDQNPESQEAELRAGGCERVFVDHGESSRIPGRPHWVACLAYLRAGDSLIIQALDRVAGSDVMALHVVRDLGERGISLKSLTEPALSVDVSTPMGRALLGVLAVFAQLRVDTIRDRTKRGVAYARDVKGKTLGRPTVMTPERIDAALRMREDGTSTAAVARALGVGESSVRRALDRATVND